jgi:hypothetical protein
MDMESAGMPVVIGEFSLATDNCAMWLNGFNVSVCTRALAHLVCGLTAPPLRAFAVGLLERGHAHNSACSTPSLWRSERAIAALRMLLSNAGAHTRTCTARCAPAVSACHRCVRPLSPQHAPDVQ